MALNDPKTPYSPAWWMQRLTDRQTKRLPRLNKLQAWLDNTPPLPEGAASWQETYRAFHKDTVTNVALLATGSVGNRLTPLGFRTGASDDDNGDAVAAEVWNENRMDVEQVDLIQWMLGLSDSYTMVGPPADGERIPIVTVEDPRQVITAHDPARRQLIRAGMKILHDPEEGEDICHIYVPADPKLYDPNRSTTYTARRKARNGTQWAPSFRFDGRQGWRWDEPVTGRTKRVPIARLENRGGVAEFEPHLSILGRINRITLQRMLVGEIQSFRQRAVKGLPTHWQEGHPLAGQEIDYKGIFTPGPGSLWQVPEGVDFWESQPIDIRPFLDEERMEYRTASAMMGIPVSYFNPDDTNGSAEGASLQREGLVYRAEDRQTIAGAGLNLTMSLAFETMGEKARQPLAQIETIWAPIERLSLTERYNAAVQGKAAGLANNTIRRQVLKMTPREMEQAEADDALDKMRGVSNQGPSAMEALSIQSTRGAAVRQPRQPEQQSSQQQALPAGGN